LDKFCLSDKADVLTNKGWVNITKVTKNHLIATLEDGNYLKYVKPVDVYNWDYDGKMYKLRSQQVDLDVTVDHELYVKRRGQKDFELISASNVHGKRIKFKKNCVNNNPDIEYITIPKYGDQNEKQIRMDDYLKSFYVKTISKHLPDYVWNLSEKQSKILLESLIEGDDHNEKTYVNYNTSSKGLADDVMRLAIHAGYGANISLGKMSKELSNVDSFTVCIMKSKNEPEINHGQDGQSEELYDYKGKVYCLEVPSHVFMIRQNNKNVWIGNCSRHGQKGTVGITRKHSDMPFTADGLTPDIILNPNAIPSRMTIGQLVECLVGKVAAMRGHEADGTPFNRIDIEAIKNELEKLGYERNGTEYLYNGMTGQKLKSMIFIGPTYYQRLKHLVFDKVHCLTMDHEVLTSTGWKFYNQLTMDDNIATLNDGKVDYQKPLKLLHFPNYQGKLYTIKGNDIDLQVTSNHRMLVSLSDNKWELVEAQNLIGKDVKYKTGIQNDKSDYSEIVINSNGNYLESLIDYVGEVFCLEMTNETFYVRRNNMAVWTGNSRARGPRTLLTRQPPEGRSRDGGLRLGKPFCPSEK